ncbi:hypothetical protein [Novispirillum itersonii]|uniref:hypothetical protein n=1 Tax=Novispirillum itersonii TaxID=189 RepID=UPI0012DCE9EC|nr:hypothetical protein [Novispirillum itersonii]
MMEIKCSNCMSINRVDLKSENKNYVCDDCGFILMSTKFYSEIKSMPQWKHWFILIAVAFCFYSSTFIIEEFKRSIKTSDRVAILGAASEASKAPPSLPPSLPFKTGVDQVLSTKERMAPLKIKTPQGSGKYYIKLVDIENNKTAMTFFINGGDEFRVDVPLGVYRLRYAVGDSWYGYKNLFGPETMYSEADRDMSFYIKNGSVSGYAVELILRKDGNMKTKNISPNDF